MHSSLLRLLELLLKLGEVLLDLLLLLLVRLHRSALTASAMKGVSCVHIQEGTMSNYRYQLASWEMKEMV